MVHYLHGKGSGTSTTNQGQRGAVQEMSSSHPQYLRCQGGRCIEYVIGDDDKLQRGRGRGLP